MKILLKKGKTKKQMQDKEVLYKVFMNSDDLLYETIQHLMNHPNEPNLQAICEKIHIKILNSGKNYT